MNCILEALNHEGNEIRKICFIEVVSEAAQLFLRGMQITFYVLSQHACLTLQGTKKSLPGLNFHKFTRAYLNNLTSENSERVFSVSIFVVVFVVLWCFGFVLFCFSSQGSLAFKICISIFEANQSADISYHAGCGVDQVPHFPTAAYTGVNNSDPCRSKTCPYMQVSFLTQYTLPPSFPLSSLLRIVIISQ